MPQIKRVTAVGALPFLDLFCGEMLFVIIPLNQA
jgi:hypothetical protein